MIRCAPMDLASCARARGTWPALKACDLSGSVCLRHNAAQPFSGMMHYPPYTG